MSLLHSYFISIVPLGGGGLYSFYITSSNFFHFMTYLAQVLQMTSAKYISEAQGRPAAFY